MVACESSRADHDVQVFRSLAARGGPMKIMVMHNLYQQRGGEEAEVAAETQLLETKGHAVIRYERHNDDLRGQGVTGSIGAAIDVVWSSRSVRELEGLIAT